MAAKTFQQEMGTEVGSRALSLRNGVFVVPEAVDGDTAGKDNLSQARERPEVILQAVSEQRNGTIGTVLQNMFTHKHLLQQETAKCQKYIKGGLHLEEERQVLLLSLTELQVLRNGLEHFSIKRMDRKKSATRIPPGLDRVPGIFSHTSESSIHSQINPQGVNELSAREMRTSGDAAGSHMTERGAELILTSLDVRVHQLLTESPKKRKKGTAEQFCRHSV
ncbi:hypothetical protein P7K49_024027 [Saguinus oedipus]|uniref:Uncharacterized protein n=1 Tax=Saguinus oedipus TaxID=9490 RepID=A0ABQ9UNC5_SAGOE|nr:hypothetical protein P7K49_024027 [Saguinus oedipus]